MIIVCYFERNDFHKIITNLSKSLICANTFMSFLLEGLTFSSVVDVVS